MTAPTLSPTRPHPPSRAQTYRETGAWTDDILPELVAAVVASTPERPAVIAGERQLTYGALHDVALRCATGLQQSGVRPGDVVAVQLPPVAEFVPTVLAIERLGAVVMPVIPRLDAGALAAALGAGAPAAIVTVGQAGRHRPAQTVGRLLDDGASPRGAALFVVGDGPRPQGARRWQELTVDAADRLPDPPSADDLAEIVFTSGTTGSPKGVLHTHNTSLSGIRSNIARQRIGPDDVVHVVLPVGHNFGYFYGVRIALAAGATIVLQRRWDPERMLQLCGKHRVTVSAGTPTHLSDLLQVEDAWRGRLDALRLFTCSGAPLPRDLAATAIEQLPGRLSTAFGMSELGHATATGPDDPPDKTVTTVGRPQPEMQVHIASPDDTDHHAGAITFRGPFLFVGYADDPDATEAAFTADGFFRTGDLGVLDGDGYLIVRGRLKETIIRGGENIPVADVESALRGHPAVADVAVVGAPDDRLGQRPVACIVPQPDQTLGLADLHHHLQDQRIAQLYWPEALQIVERIPRNPTGKILRDELARTVDTIEDG